MVAHLVETTDVFEANNNATVTGHLAIKGPNQSGGTFTCNITGAATNLPLGDLSGVDYAVAASFIANGGVLSQFTIELISNVGSPTGTMTWAIEADDGAGHPDDVAIDSGTWTPTASAVNTVNITDGPELTAGTKYWLVITPTTTNQGTDNRWRWKCSNLVEVNANSTSDLYNRSTASWVGPYTTYDLDFTITEDPIYENTHIAQSFTPTSDWGFGELFFLLRKVGSPTGTVSFSLYTDAACSDITDGKKPNTQISGTTSDTIDVSTLLTSDGFYTLKLSPRYTMSAGTTYHIVITASYAQSDTDYVEVAYADSGLGGNMAYRQNGSWTCIDKDLPAIISVTDDEIRIDNEAVGDPMTNSATPFMSLDYIIDFLKGAVDLGENQFGTIKAYVYVDPDNPDISLVRGFRLTDDISVAGKLNVEIVSATFQAVPNLRNKKVELYQGSQRIAEGTVESRSFSIDKDVLFIDLDCSSELGYLTQIKAKSDAVYVDEPILFVLADLLSLAPDWRLNYVHSMFDYAEVITIDLRGAGDTLFSQIKTLVDRLPDTYFRYGGKDNLDYHLFDFGSFRSDTGEAAVQGSNLLGLKHNPRADRLIQTIEAYGGKAGSREVTLEDAKNYDATLLTHPDYPISQAADGTWIVTDNSVTDGGSLLLRFGDIKPLDTDAPAAGEINEAGYAVWNAARRKFIKNNSDVEHYDATLYIEEGIKTQRADLKLGDLIFINSDVLVPVFNHITEDYELRSLFQIAQTLPIASVEYTYDSGFIVTAVKTGNRPIMEVIDHDLQLYDKLKKSEQLEDATAAIASASFSRLSTTHTGATPADTTMADGSPAKLFDVTTPAPPGGATGLYYALYVEPASADVEIVQFPSFAGNNPIVKVNIDGRWEETNQATLYCVYMYY